MRVGTGLKGTFVISWTQTELDGERDAAVSALGVGMAWRWTGEATRVDGPASVLPLGNAIGAQELRDRAAVTARVLTGVESVEPAEPDASADFVVTDGYGQWPINIAQSGSGAAPLLVFAEDLPPRGRDLWVVSVKPQPHENARSDQGIICFTTGTRVLTARGPRPVEALARGDMVQTKDNGLQPVLWHGTRQISGARMKVMPHLAPIRLRAGALDGGVPDEDIIVSPDHRMLLRGARAQALFNTDEVLVGARDLLNDNTIRVARGLSHVTYHHILLPAHQIVFANGVETESFHPGYAGLNQGQTLEIEQSSPYLLCDPSGFGGFARRVLTASEAAILRSDVR